MVGCAKVSRTRALTLPPPLCRYVKEFVHGDCGRTRPCLADVLSGGGGASGTADCDILMLDVVGVRDTAADAAADAEDEADDAGD